MAGITLATAQTMLDAAVSALTDAMKVQSYSTSTDTDSFSASNQSIESLQESVAYWDAKVKRLTRGGGVRFKQMVYNGN